jgi:hypothetical protein
METFSSWRRYWIIFELVLSLSLALVVSVGGVAFFWPRTFGSGYPVFGLFAYTAGVIERSEMSGCGRRSERIDLAYRYSVAGKNYVGSKLMHEDCFHYSREWLNEIQRGYLPGDSVIVYYNPTSPQYSVLRKDFPSGFVMFPLTIVGFLSALVVIARNRVRRLRGSGVRASKHPD